jgi:uncharacterized protein
MIEPQVSAPRPPFLRKSAYRIAQAFAGRQASVIHSFLFILATPNYRPHMKKNLFFLSILCALSAEAQTDSLKALAEITAFQRKLNDEYKNVKESPLEPKDFKKFKGHAFFPVDLKYRVKAKLMVTEGTPFLQMKTTTSQYSTDRVYGFVEFALEGNEFRLPVYQSKALMNTAAYADYLFFPFTDLTNGKQTYTAGRYIDLRIPSASDELVIDFNMAYNPYCAYNHKYSCPLVPAENQMDIEIPAGVIYKN